MERAATEQTMMTPKPQADPGRHGSALVLGVASGAGQLRPGVERGPAEIRRAGLRQAIERAGWTYHDAGDVIPQISGAGSLPEKGLRNVSAVLDVCRQLEASLAPGLNGATTKPIVLGGDHSISLGTCAALAGAGRHVGLLWVDAHGDFNTAKTSPSGNVHGMALAAIAGIGDERLTRFAGDAPLVAPENIVLLGIRDIDPREKAVLRDSGITYFTITDIEEFGIRDVAEEALRILTRRGNHVHVSFDVDAIDPLYAPGTGTPVPGGLSHRETRVLMQRLAAGDALDSLDVVEVNPLLDRDGITSRLAVDIVSFALGETIV